MSFVLYGKLHFRGNLVKV